MEFSEALELGRNAFWMTLTTSAPILIIGLVLGLAIAMFQAVTQLQEQTLTFVPKIIVMIGVAILLLGWITVRVSDFAVEMFSGF